MGYRTHIASMPKTEHDKIKNFTKEKLFKHYKIKSDDYLGVYEIAKNELYEFGKYTEFDDKKYYKSVFKNRKLQRYYTEEGDFYIVEKKFLKHIIEHYTEKIKSYYDKMIIPFYNKEKPSKFLSTIKSEYDKDLEYKYVFDFSKITQDEQTQLFKMVEHIRDMRSEWGNRFGLFAYDLDNGDQVTRSWKYEYSIFELVRIYKTFDWKNNVMIYYGY